MDKDSVTTIESLRRKVVKHRDERDWKQFHSPKNLAIAIAIEAAELLEIFRFRNDPEALAVFKDKKKKALVVEELVHIIWQCLNFSDVAEIDISSGLEKALREAGKKYLVDKYKGRPEKYNEL